MPSKRLPDAPFTEPLATAVRARRNELGLSQIDLARLAGCGVVFVYAVEQAKTTLRLDKLVDLLAVLGLGLELAPGPSGIRVRGGAGEGS